MQHFLDITGPDGSRESLERRGGFALPAVLVLLMVLSTISAFYVASGSNEQRNGRAMRESARSFYAADAGVNAVLAEWKPLLYDSLLSVPGDSADLGWRTLVNGATYKAVFIRVDGGDIGPPIHTLRVVGRGAGLFGGSTTIFREIMFGNDFSVDATITGGVNADELEVDSIGLGTVTVSGRDTIPAQWASEGICGPLADKPGAVWWDTMTVDIDGSSGSVFDGAPPLVEDPTLNMTDLMTFGSFTYDDLVAMADITFPEIEIDLGIGPTLLAGKCDTGNRYNWGDPLDPTSPCFDYFPIIHFTDEVEITTTGGVGQGIMLVDNELEIENMTFPFDFYGLIIQRGPGAEGMEFEEPGINIYGAMIAGGEVEIEDGAAFRYSQCAVRRALEAHNMIDGLMERGWRRAMD